MSRNDGSLTTVYHIGRFRSSSPGVGTSSLFSCFGRCKRRLYHIVLQTRCECGDCFCKTRLAQRDFPPGRNFLSAAMLGFRTQTARHQVQQTVVESNQRQENRTALCQANKPRQICRGLSSPTSGILLAVLAISVTARKIPGMVLLQFPRSRVRVGLNGAISVHEYPRNTAL